WVAHTGCRSGLSSAGLIHATYGHGFARLPVLLNIVQLLGWTTFELVVMRDGSVDILRQLFGLDTSGWLLRLAATLCWGLIVLALLSASMLRLVRRIDSRVTLPLVIVSLLWLTWQFTRHLDMQALTALWQRPGNAGMNMFTALDLVIAMPVSWLPLVADYARHGKNAGTTLTGTWSGYVL